MSRGLRHFCQCDVNLSTLQKMRKNNPNDGANVLSEMHVAHCIDDSSSPEMVGMRATHNRAALSEFQFMELSSN